MSKRRCGILATVMVLVLALFVVPVSAMDFTPSSWGVTGGGTTGITTNAQGYLVFTYDYRGYNQTWNFTATATETETVSLTYVYNCFHSWYLASAQVTVWVNGPAGTYSNTFYNGGNASGATGTLSLNLNAGYTYGFRIVGSNWDSSRILQGNLAIIENQHLTFDSAGGSAVATIGALPGASLSAPANPTRTGYTFAGWSPSFPATMPDGGASLTAQWTINSYTIDFDSAGGSAVESITDDYGTDVPDVTDPTRTGYTFAGWSPSIPATMPAGGADLTAQWTANSYTINFDSAGGSAVESITDDYGTDVPDVTDPTYTGYTFAGWSPSIPATMPVGGADLTAQWTINSYTVTFDSAGGSAVESITDDYGTDVPDVTNPKRTGYTFTGWSPSLPETMPAGGADLTAQWTINSYTVTFDSAGGPAVTPITDIYGAALPAVTDPTWAGHTFTGWSPSLPANMPAEDVVLTAQWTRDSYTVTFYNWDGTVLSAQTVLWGDNAVAPSLPAREGYRFTGWSVLGADIRANTTITARYALAAPKTGELEGTDGLIGGLLLTAGALFIAVPVMKKRRKSV